MKLIKYFLLVLFSFESLLSAATLIEQGNLYVTGDYIYWKSTIDKLEYAITGVGFPLVSGKTKKLHWKWHSGFKAGIGYRFCDCGWDLYLNSTWFNNKARASVRPKGEEFLFGTFYNPVLFDLAFASSKFDIHYKTLDFEIGNTYCLTPCFSFRPSFGLRAAWVKDKDHIEYLTFPGSTEIIDMKESFHGVGPRIGITVNWEFCKDWSIFGEGNYALVWGTTRTHFFSEAFNAVAANTRQHINAIRHLTDIRVGLSWDHCFCASRVVINLAWEHRLWLNYNQYQKFVGELFSISYVNNSADLSTYGLTLSAKYYF